MKELRIAVPTKTHAGLNDFVSDVFGKAKTFTIVDIENKEIKNVQIIDNPAASYPHGAGPVAVKTLADLNVNLVMAVEFGPGASTLIEHHNIRKSSLKRNTKVADSIRETLSKMNNETT